MYAASRSRPVGPSPQLGALPEVGQRARRRIAVRLLPFLFALYVIAYLDRVNVAYANLEMSRDLGFSDRVFGLGAGIFFVGYFLLEIPGALIVERWSARRWIARIMISWGLVTLWVAFVHTPRQFYLARTLLGAAEAGFFPGIIVYLTHWFRYEDRAKAVAFFMTAIPISNILGSPLAGWLLGVRWYGLQGWRWLFIVEGIPAIVLGLLTLFFLADWPHQARWLPGDEREWLTRELEREREAKRAAGSYTIRQALGQREVLLLALVYFLSVTSTSGFVFWYPTILKRASGLPNLTVTLLAALPYVVALAAMLWNGAHSDSTGERRWHTAIWLFAGGTFFACAILFGSRLWLAIAFFTGVGACVLAYFPSFWPLPTALLSESAAAASIGLINSIGNLGGFTGPFVVGYLRTRTGSFAPGLTYLLASLFLAGFLVLVLPPRKPTAGTLRSAKAS